MCDKQTPCVLIETRLRELLSEVEVAIRSSLTSSNVIAVFYLRRTNLAMNMEISRHLVREMIESDERGLDAMGLNQIEAMFMVVGMSLDPQYAGKPHRIPPPTSGLRLSRFGELCCSDIALKVTRELTPPTL